MKKNWKLSTAAVALSIFGAGITSAQAQTAATASADRSIEDIVVTATRREEAVNKIPLAIQALGGESLQKLNIVNFEKLVEYLPNVRTASQGPGTSAMYIRGLSTDTPGLQITGTAGSQPNVALYLNDAPSSMPGRNLDVYAVDLQRVEVLAGPQGTLFGASAMGGAVRYITNKPDMKEYHTGFDGS
jgi:outer membrane receptor protein involved in Fe transport